jgi:hypothetical protein
MQQQATQLAAAVSVFKLDATKATQPAPAEPAEGARKAPLVERRGPNRAKNVSRLPVAKATVAPKVVKSGTDDEWTEF